MDEEFLRRMTSQIGKPVPDKYYTEIKAHPFVQSERMFVQGEGASEAELDALMIGCKAETVFNTKNYTKARKMAMEAFLLDPNSDDAHRVLALVSAPEDLSSGAEMLTEILNLKRRQWQWLADSNPGEFYNHATTRRFMRLMWNLAMLYDYARHIDMACWTFEEILRLNLRDNMGARFYILPLYIKLMALRKRRIPCIKRGPKHIRALINYVDPAGDHIFESGSRAVNWANIFLAWYEKKPEFSRLLRAEYQSSKFIGKLIMGRFLDLPIDRSAPMKPGVKIQISATLSNQQGEQEFEVGPALKAGFACWPEFIMDVQRILKPNQEPIEPKLPEFIIMYEDGTMTKMIGEALLEKSRHDMKDGRAALAMRNLSLARATLAMMAAFDRKRFTTEMPFAVFSNRATMAERMGDMPTCRFESRCTLAVKPDHARTYARIPGILKAFKADALAAEAEELAAEVAAFEASEGEKNEEEWKAFAQRGIFLLSMQAIILSKTRKLTSSLRQELMETGIEDLFTPLNWPADKHPLLPWLTEEDLDHGL